MVHCVDSFKPLDNPYSIFLLLGDVEPGNGFTPKRQMRILPVVKPSHYQIQYG